MRLGSEPGGGLGVGSPVRAAAVGLEYQVDIMNASGGYTHEEIIGVGYCRNAGRGTDSVG